MRPRMHSYAHNQALSRTEMSIVMSIFKSISTDRTLMNIFVNILFYLNKRPVTSRVKTLDVTGVPVCVS